MAPAESSGSRVGRGAGNKQRIIQEYHLTNRNKEILPLKPLSRPHEWEECWRLFQVLIRSGPLQCSVFTWSDSNQPMQLEMTRLQVTVSGEFEDTLPSILGRTFTTIGITGLI